MKNKIVISIALLISGALPAMNITESAFVTELTDAQFDHNATINDVAWMANDGRIYLVIGGAPFTINTVDINMRLLEFDPYQSSIDMIAGGVPPQAQFGTETAGTVSALAWLKLGNARYLAVGGNEATNADPAATYTMAIYRFLESPQQLLQAANPLNTNSTVNSVAWYGITSDEIYLAVGANTGGDSTPRVLTFNMQTETLVNPIAADTPHAVDVHSVAWTKVGEQAYLAIGGAGDDGVTTRLYTWDAPALTLVPGANQSHGNTVRSVDWVSLGSARYLATGGATGGGVQVRIYSLGATTPATLTEVATFDFGQAVNKVKWLNYGGELYLAMVGDATANPTAGPARIAKFNPTAGTLTSVFELPSHGADNRAAAWIQYGALAYLATAGAAFDDITNRTFRVNFNADVINALLRRKYFQNFTNTAPASPLAIVSL